MVGRIVAVGDGVEESRVGERVILNFVTYEPNPDALGFAGSLAQGFNGGYAEYLAAQSAQAYEIGDSPLSDAELATFPCAYMTGEHMLAEAGVEAGEAVLITGASGGRGLGADPARPCPRRARRCRDQQGVGRPGGDA